MFEDDFAMLLAAIDDPKRLRELVDAGARVPDPQFPISLIHYAALRGNVETLGILLSAGGDRFLNSFDQWSASSTPLTNAAKEGHADAVRFLINKGADVNAHDESRVGNTAIREVIDEGPYAIIKILVDAGANPWIPGWMQLTAVQIAEKRFLEQSDADSKAILDLVSAVPQK